MQEQERYTPGAGLPETQYEHLHRYALAQSLAAGRDVVDLGCGEGYGAHRLSLVARSVRAVDLAAEAVSAARVRYAASHLRFLVGDATHTGLEDASADLVVAFEIYEHLENPADLLAEARRLLRPGGLLLVSTPNRAVYSEARGYQNPFHRHEADRQEFARALRLHFPQVRLHGQRILRLSAIWDQAGSDGPADLPAAALRDVPPVYLLGLCGDAALPDLPARSFWLDPNEVLDTEASELVVARATIAAKDEELGAARATISGKDAELRAAAGTINAKDGELAQARAAIEDLKGQVENAREQLARVGVDVAQARAAAEGARHELAAALAVRDLREAELREARDRSRALEAEAQRQAALLEEREAQAARAQETVDALVREGERGAGAAEQLQGLVGQLEEVRAALVSLTASLPAGGAGRWDGLAAAVEEAVRNLRPALPPAAAPAPPAVHGAPLQVIGQVEEPAGQVRRHGEIVVGGWAFSPLGPIDRITVRFAGRVVATAEQGLPRPDVHTAHPLPAALQSGFRARFGAHLVPRFARGVRVVAEVGRQRTILGTVRFVPRPPLLLRALRSLRGTVRVGMTYARQGRIPRNPLAWPKLIRSGWRFWRAGLASDAVAARQLVVYDAYEEWVRGHTLTPAKLRALAAEAAAFTVTPRISVVVAVHNVDEQWLRRCLDSVVDQTYEHWELCVADDCSTAAHVRPVLREYEERLGSDRFRLVLLETPHHISRAINAAAAGATGEYLAFLDHDDELTLDALQVMVRAMQQTRADLYYSDDDKVDAAGGRYAPQFKPDWSPELLLSYAYISHLLLLRTELFRSLEGFRQGFEGSQDYDLLLRVAERSPQVVHIPRILYHWRALPQSTAASTSAKSYSLDTGRRAVAEALTRRGLAGEVTQPRFAKDAGLGIFRIDYRGIPEPLVSIIIPTHNGRFLERCLESLQEHTDYANLEILVADNLSDDPRTVDYLAGLTHRVLRIAHPANGRFSFAHVNNQAARHASGDYLLFLNDDTEALEPGWLRSMVGVLQNPEIGAVGARLLYPDRRIQHAGVLVGGGPRGLARHAFRSAGGDYGGYLSYAQVMRNYSAVTAACLLTRRALFEELGGFDEVHFAVAYNDVDYCLRVRERGLRVVYQPDAVLLHHEGVSRGYRDDPREEAAFEERWVRGRHDPYDNENLRKDSDLFEINPGHLDPPLWHRPAHVALVGHNLNVEGAPLFQYNIAKELAAGGWACDVLAPQDGPLQSRYAAAGITPQVVSHPLVGATGAAMLRERLHRVGRGWRDAGVEVVHANTLHGYWAVLAAQAAGLPSVWSIHESVDPREYFRQLPGFTYDLALDALETAGRVVFVADATRRIFAEAVGRPFRLITIPNGLDVARVERFCAGTSREQARQDLGVAEGRFVWLIVGTTAPRKGQLYFVRAAASVLGRREGRDCEFWIVGARESPYLAEVRQAIAASPDPSRFRVVDETPDVYPYYRAADGFVCASLEESLPAVVLEAFAFGLPLVSTDVYGIPEMVRREVDGLLVAPQDPVALADGMLRVLRDAQGAGARAASALGRLQQFCLTEMVRAYGDLFLQMVEAGGVHDG